MPGKTVAAFLIVAILHVHTTKAAQAGPAEPNHIDQGHIDHVLEIAAAARVTPHPEFTSLHGNIIYRLLRLSGEGFVLTIAPEAGAVHSYVYFVLCSPGGSDPPKVVDAVILGPRESALAFYEANLKFALAPDADFARCMPPGFELERRGRVSESPSRALRHLAAWLHFFSMYRGDLARSADMQAAQHHVEVVRRVRE